MLALPVLIHQCVPQMIQPYMSAIVKVESKGNPLALGLNHGYKLAFQPTSEKQARKWIRALEQNHYNFDIGLAQVNITNVAKYGYSSIDLLDPCTNLKVASNILIHNYKEALTHSKLSHTAMQQAISAYNTGNFSSGFINGYVHKVYAVTRHEKSILLADNNNSDVPPIIPVDKPLSGANSGGRISTNNTDAHTDINSNANRHSNPYSSPSLLYIEQKKVTQLAYNNE